MNIIDLKIRKLGKNRKFGQRLRERRKKEERKKKEERPVLELSLRELKIAPCMSQLIRNMLELHYCNLVKNLLQRSVTVM